VCVCRWPLLLLFFVARRTHEKHSLHVKPLKQINALSMLFTIKRRVLIDEQAKYVDEQYISSARNLSTCARNLSRSGRNVFFLCT
jgi:hypothetical protein